MDIHSLARHVDFNNPVSWLALYAALLTTAGTVLNLVKALRDRCRLRVEAIVQGRHRAWSPDEARAEVGDFVTLTLLNNGPKPIVLSHVCGERVEGRLRLPFTLYQHPKTKLEPGEQRTAWILDARNLDESLSWLGAGDHLGNTWKLPRRDLNRLIREERVARRAAMAELCQSAPEAVPQ
jgi:hypothetical protein